MELEGRTASIDKNSQEILKEEDVRAQIQYLYNLDRMHIHNNKFNNATKIFVGGLPSDLTTEEFKAYFEKFGSIEDAVVMCDKETSRPRGFGFVTFKSPETANNVTKTRFHDLKNKLVEVKKAVSKEQMGRNLGSYYNTFANLNWYVYGMNAYRYGGYSGLGYEGFSYVYYPYQNPNLDCYINTWPYRYLYDYAPNYSYQSPYNFGNTQNISKKFEKYRNRTRVVMKKNSDVKDCEDSDVELKEKGEKGCDLSRQSESTYVERVVNDVLEDFDGLSLHSDGSSRQRGADGWSSCTADL